MWSSGETSVQVGGGDFSWVFCVCPPVLPWCHGPSGDLLALKVLLRMVLKHKVTLERKPVLWVRLIPGALDGGRQVRPLLGLEFASPQGTLGNEGHRSLPSPRCHHSDKVMTGNSRGKCLSPREVAEE